eukprot:GHVN01011068.1.p1 GENE.GHVN01011068.1~~GHVN01011068.1.p1  ORF type:complete len:665 (-),score=57.33 GHVN01011068.1:558-2552(-)
MVCGVTARENVEQNGCVAKLVDELGDSPPQPQLLDSRAFEQYQNHENAPSSNGLQSISNPNKSACGWSLEGVCGAGLLNSCMKEEGGKIGYDELASTAKRQYYFLTRGDSEDINIAHILQKILEKRVPDLRNSGLPSIGSVLHDDGICKPCVFANKNNKNCRNGEACLFCHHDHKEKRRRSKRSKTSPLDTSMLPSTNQEAAAIGFRSRFFQSRTQDQLVAGGLTASSCKGGWASSFTPTPSCLKNEQQETGLEAMLNRVSIDDLSSLPAPRCQFTEQGQGMGVDQQQQRAIGTPLPSRSAWSTSWSFSTPQTSEPTRRAASSNAEVWRQTNGSFSPEPLGQRASSAPSSSQGNACVNVSNHNNNDHHYCRLPGVNTPGHPFTSNCAQPHQPTTSDMNIASLLNFLSDSPPHAQSPNLVADHLQADARSVPGFAHSALGASAFSSCERGYNGSINASGGYLGPNQDFPDSSFWRPRVTVPEMFAQETLPMQNCEAAAREPPYWPAGCGGIGGIATGEEEPFLWDHCGSDVHCGSHCGSYDFPDLNAKAFGVPAHGGSLDPAHLGPIVGGNARNSITNQAGDGQFNFQNVNSFGDPHIPPLPIHENLHPLGSCRFGINHDAPEEIASFSHLLKNIIEGFGIPARPVQAGEDQRPVGPIKSPGRVE